MAIALLNKVSGVSFNKLFCLVNYEINVYLVHLGSNLISRLYRLGFHNDVAIDRKGMGILLGQKKSTIITR